MKWRQGIESDVAESDLRVNMHKRLRVQNFQIRVLQQRKVCTEKYTDVVQNTG
jgi:hypothetical protein